MHKKGEATFNNFIVFIVIYFIALNMFLFSSAGDLQYMAEGKAWDSINESVELEITGQETAEITTWNFISVAWNKVKSIYEIMSFGGFIGVEENYWLNKILFFFFQIIPMLIITGGLTDWIRGK